MHLHRNYLACIDIRGYLACFGPGGWAGGGTMGFSYVLAGCLAEASCAPGGDHAWPGAGAGTEPANPGGGPEYCISGGRRRRGVR